MFMGDACPLPRRAGVIQVAKGKAGAGPLIESGLLHDNTSVSTLPLPGNDALQGDHIFDLISLPSTATPSRIFSGGTVTKLRRRVLRSGVLA